MNTIYYGLFIIMLDNNDSIIIEQMLCLMIILYYYYYYECFGFDRLYHAIYYESMIF